MLDGFLLGKWYIHQEKYRKLCFLSLIVKKFFLNEFVTFLKKIKEVWEELEKINKIKKYIFHFLVEIVVSHVSDFSITLFIIKLILNFSFKAKDENYGVFYPYGLSGFDKMAKIWEPPYLGPNIIDIDVPHYFNCLLWTCAQKKKNPTHKNTEIYGENPPISREKSRDKFRANPLW